MGAAAHARNLIGPLLSAAYRVRITGGHHLPRRGGVLIVTEQTGLLDPTILATSLTRPVRMLVEPSDGAPRWQPVTNALGRIELTPGCSPWAALQEAEEALVGGDAVGVFLATPFAAPSVAPPGALAAYLQARSGVPLVPVSLFDSHGPRPTDPPRPRTRISIHVGPPIHLVPPADPVSAPEIRRHAEAIRQVFADAHAQALLRSGRSPVPPPATPWQQNDPRG